MKGVNKVILVGVLGKDPEKDFCKWQLTQFSIATSDTWTDKQSTRRNRMALHNRLGEIAQQYLRKGSKVYIEGSLRPDRNGRTITVAKLCKCWTATKAVMVKVIAGTKTKAAITKHPNRAMAMLHNRLGRL